MHICIYSNTEADLIDEVRGEGSGDCSLIKNNRADENFISENHSLHRMKGRLIPRINQDASESRCIG